MPPLLKQILLVSFFCIAANAPVVAIGLERPEEELKQIGLTTALGTKLHTDTILQSSEGTKVTLGDILSSGKPLILVPVYYRCPRICGFLLDGVARLISSMSLNLGTDYRLAVLSFDPTEGPEVAKEQLGKYLEKLPKKEWPADGINFLTASEASITTIMKDIGFNYVKDGMEFAHSPAIMVVTPQGEVSQYFTGIDLPAWDVKLALVQATDGKIGTPIDHIMLFCYRFDPTKGRYTLAVFNVLRLGGLVTLLAFVILYAYLYRGRLLPRYFRT